MTEEQKERRRKQANAIRVLASPMHMPLEEFEKRFIDRWIIADMKARDEVERTTQEMFCDECLSPIPNTAGITANVLHVTIENDPLRNFWMLATMRCYGCGFEEIVPLGQPEFTADDFNMGVSTPAPIFGPPPFQGVSHWMQEYERQRGVFARQQAIAGQQQMKGLAAAPDESDPNWATKMLDYIKKSRY